MADSSQHKDKTCPFSVAAYSIKSGYSDSGISLTHFGPNLRANHQLSPNRAILIYKVWQDFEKSQRDYPLSFGLIHKTKDLQFEPIPAKNLRSIPEISHALYSTLCQFISELQSSIEEPFCSVYKIIDTTFKTHMIMMPSETVESDLLRGVSTATNIIFRSYSVLTQMLLTEANSNDEHKRLLARQTITSEEKFKQFLEDCSRLPSILALTSVSTINYIEDSMYVNNTILSHSFALRFADDRIIPETSKYGTDIIEKSIHHTYEFFTGCPAGYSVKELNSHLAEQFGLTDCLLEPHSMFQNSPTTLKALLTWCTQAVAALTRSHFEEQITESNCPLKAG